MWQKCQNNDNVHRNNPCEQKAPASDCSEHSVSNGFYYSQPELMSVCDGFLYMDICYVHLLPAGCSAVCCSAADLVCCVSPPLWFIEICSWTLSPPTCPTLVSDVTVTCPIRGLKQPPDKAQSLIFVQ